MHESAHTFFIVPAFAFALLAAAGAAPLLLAVLCSVLCSATVTAAALTDRLICFPAQGQEEVIKVPPSTSDKRSLDAEVFRLSTLCHLCKGGGWPLSQQRAVTEKGF